MSDYLLAGREEMARLQLQARVWEPEAEAMLDAIGLENGGTAIDLGCGAMGILGPLSRRIGLEGQVIGLEANEKLLSAAELYTQQEGLTNVNLRQGDAVKTGLPDDQFDLVHARFLFPHVPEPSILLSEMIRLARPGGVVAVQEPDHSSWNFYPLCSAWPEFLRLMEQALGMGGDINIGRRLYSLFKDSGLTDINIRAGVIALKDRHPYMRMTVVGAQAMKDRMVAAGMVTAERLEQLIEAVETCADDPERIQITFTTIQVWGKKEITS